MNWKPSSTSGLGTVILTGAVCLILVGTLSFVGFELRKQLPSLFPASVVINLAVLYTGYKVIMTTLKNAADLRKAGLEIRKLQLEITEKEEAAKKADSRIVSVTLDEIKEYGNLLQRVPFGSTALSVKYFQMGLVVALATAVIVGALLVSSMKQEKDTEIARLKELFDGQTALLKKYGTSKGSIGLNATESQIRIECDRGKIWFMGPGMTVGSLVFGDGSIPEENLKLILRTEEYSFQFPLKRAGQHYRGSYMVAGGALSPLFAAQPEKISAYGNIPIFIGGTLEIVDSEGARIALCQVKQSQPESKSP
jgi:hypothetical protein